MQKFCVASTRQPGRPQLASSRAWRLPDRLEAAYNIQIVPNSPAVFPMASIAQTAIQIAQLVKRVIDLINLSNENK